MTKFSDYLKDLRKSGQLSFTIDKVVSDLKILKRNALVTIHRIKKRLEILAKDVKKLMELTEEICEAKIVGFDT